MAGSLSRVGGIPPFKCGMYELARRYVVLARVTSIPWPFLPMANKCFREEVIRGVRLWDIESGKQVRQFHGHRARVEALAIAPEGQYAASWTGALGANEHLLRQSAFPSTYTFPYRD